MEFLPEAVILHPAIFALIAGVAVGSTITLIVLMNSSLSYIKNFFFLRSNTRRLFLALEECVLWLETRPDYTEGDAATSSSGRYVLEETRKALENYGKI